MSNFIYNSDRSFLIIQKAVRKNLIPQVINTNCMKALIKDGITFEECPNVSGLLKASGKFTIEGNKRSHHRFLLTEKHKYILYYFPLSNKEFIGCISRFEQISPSFILPNNI